MPQENAHFQAADMIISAMETMKWDLLSGQRVEIRSPDEAGGSPGGDSGGSEVAVYTHGRQDSGSSTSSDSGCEGTWGGGDSCMLPSARPSTSSVDSGSTSLNPLSKTS